jgi:cytosine/adenosine deaminase-related metal-dependent hydrolase
LRGARVSIDAKTAVHADLLIAGCRIRATLEPFQESPSSESYCDIDLDGYLLLPGLINAHDHLEFNLFPKLGKVAYRNAKEWAQDIYHPESSPIREHRAVPKEVRLIWGGIKNLVTGVTTVCHHNDYCAVFGQNFPVRVIKRYAWTHSLLHGFSPESTYHSSPADHPFIIHLAEGSDDESRKEIFDLESRGLLSSRTVIVHGVALQERERRLVIDRKSAIIWCPGSNLFTLGTTLDAEFVRSYERVALGSDSALTSDDLLSQVRLAYSRSVPADVVFELVTTRSAKILNLENGEGQLAADSIADIVVVRDRGMTPAESLTRIVPQDIHGVFLAGKIQSISDQLCSRIPSEWIEGLEALTFSGTRRYVRAPIRALIDQTRKHLGDDIELAGWRIAG